MIVYLIQCEPGVYLNNRWGGTGPFNGSTCVYVKYASAVKRCRAVNENPSYARGRIFEVVPFTLQPAE